jgi:L-iditol 2-dehydrogenase
MKAVMKTKPGYGVEIKEIPEPQLSPGSALLEIKAAGICGSDIHIYEWGPYSSYAKAVFTSPKGRILGHENTAIVSEISPGSSTSLVVGDRVLVDPHVLCGKCYYCRSGQEYLCSERKTIGIQLDGGMTKYLVARINQLFKLPAQLSFEEGVILEPMAVAHHAATKANIKPSTSVVILGPGPIGLCTLLAAKLQGAEKILVAGLPEDTENGRLELAKELGAEIAAVTDEESLKKAVSSQLDTEGADVVFDATGIRVARNEVPLAINFGLRALKRKKKLVMIGLHPKSNIELDLAWWIHTEKIIEPSIGYEHKDLSKVIDAAAHELLPLEKLIDSLMPLEKGVEAFEKAAEKTSRGRIILTP